MKVTHFYTLEQEFDIGTPAFVASKAIPADVREVLGVGLCVNANALPKKVNKTFDQIGNKTECALIEFAF
jgi:hypothetical protein